MASSTWSTSGTRSAWLPAERWTCISRASLTGFTSRITPKNDGHRRHRRGQGHRRVGDVLAAETQRHPSSPFGSQGGEEAICVGGNFASICPVVASVAPLVGSV